jgi:hypothetical protein
MIPGRLVALLLAATLLDAATLRSQGEKKDRFTPQERSHWSLQPVTRPEPPAVRNASWVRSPIDAFVLSDLEAKGILPSPQADRITLLRRASLDLIGLPPSPEEVQAFLADTRPDAFERAVDRLLASPHYGERWARHWLDLARYAESEGFKSDETRPNAWRYRDYLIRSFNQDKPYDRFVREQIAGDEIWPGDADARVATAFNRHYPDESNARDLLQRRQEILNDITDTVGAVFMGLTYGCARCHDHKFDPILHADYYRLQAFFANVSADDAIALAPDAAVREHRAKMAAWESSTEKVRAEMAALEAPRRSEMFSETFEKYPAEIQAAIRKQAGERTPMERLMYFKAKPYIEPDSSEVAAGLKGDTKKRWQALRAELDRFASLHPEDLPIGTGILDAGRTAPATHVLAVGRFDAPLEEVQPGYLTILAPGPAKVEPPPGLESTGRRTALASWLADPRNPLPARVMANRIWQSHFGRGIVATASDFGSMGETPTHPKLLDWLASELVRGGWRIKPLHRLIVTSSVYRQASAARPDAAKLDPDNKLLWRFPRQRLEAEVIRDAALAVSGMLNPKLGGPSVFPELPPGMVSRGGWKVTDDPAERNRRSVYVFVRRNTRYPMFEAFDMPDTHESCPRRSVTTTAPQALTLLNSSLALEWAGAFAARVLSSAAPERAAEIDRAYGIAYGRRPSAEEQHTALAFFARQHAIIAERVAAGGKIAVPPSFLPASVDVIEAAVLVDFCHALLNSNEFVYRN